MRAGGSSKNDRGATDCAASSRGESWSAWARSPATRSCERLGSAATALPTASALLTAGHAGSPFGSGRGANLIHRMATAETCGGGRRGQVLPQGRPLPVSGLLKRRRSDADSKRACGARTAVRSPGSVRGADVPALPFQVSFRFLAWPHSLRPGVERRMTTEARPRQLPTLSYPVRSPAVAAGP